MRKILIFLVVGFILTSMSFASVGKLNVWVRNIRCDVVEKRGHLHVYNCHGNQILPNIWFDNGHVEVDVPPGCYILKAGIYIPGGNIYSDKVMVIVKCGKETCVNLYLPRFVIERPHQIEQLPLTLFYCPAAILPPLIVNAVKAGIKPEELDAAIGVIARAARIDKETLLGVVRDEIELVEGHIPKCKHKKEQKEMREYVNLLKKALSSLK